MMERRLQSASPNLTSSVQGITVLPMTTLTFKVRDEEAALIRRLAKANGITVSEYLRQKSLPPPQQKPRELVKCKYTGAMIFKGMPGDIPLSTESIKEMLADFP